MALPVNVVLVTDLNTLLEHATKEQKLRFQMDPSGPHIEVVLRPLSAQEMDAANKLTGDISPPVNQAALNKSGNLMEAYDFQNPEYRTKIEGASRLRRAFIISKGLSQFKFEGELPSISEQLRQKFPERVIRLLTEEIEKISSSDVKVIELANFTSSAGSDTPPS